MKTPRKYDLETGCVLHGVLRYPSEIDTYAIGPWDINYLLSAYVGKEILLVVLPLSELLTSGICPLCNTALVGEECPRCAALAKEDKGP